MKLVLVAVGLLLLPAGMTIASAEPTDPPNMSPFECRGQFQTGQCRTECNGDFPCCYYYYILGQESFYWCAV